MDESSDSSESETSSSYEQHSWRDRIRVSDSDDNEDDDVQVYEAPVMFMSLDNELSWSYRREGPDILRNLGMFIVQPMFSFHKWFKIVNKQLAIFPNECCTWATR